MIHVHLAGADVDADHAIHSPIHRLGLNEKLKPVPVVIRRILFSPGRLPQAST